MAVILLAAAAFYAAAGIVVAFAFAAFGVTRVLRDPVTVTVGARFLLIPGAAALWPLVLRRWIQQWRRP
ncbi:MAG TPA: hypothetical protein VFK79_03175 [Xanthobacteraceae bacterium]|nr:hypothetical protein [Xanthobacteraceae bacterium]